MNDGGDQAMTDDLILAAHHPVRLHILHPTAPDGSVMTTHLAVRSWPGCSIILLSYLVPIGFHVLFNDLKLKADPTRKSLWIVSTELMRDLREKGYIASKDPFFNQPSYTTECSEVPPIEFRQSYGTDTWSDLSKRVSLWAIQMAKKDILPYLSI